MGSPSCRGVYDHDFHGEVIVFADGDGEDFLAVEEFARTPLARRLRFWHPDYIPETYPDYYEAPFDDHEPPRRTIDPEGFFHDVAEYLEREREEAMHERRREAVEYIRTDDTFREVLTGGRPLTFTQPREAESSPKDPQLNQEQQTAAKYALLSDDLFCIHGSPATGKTRTLVEVVRRAVEAGEAVLVCADSNQAVDNLLVGESTPDEPDEGSLHAYGQHGGDEFTPNRRNVRQSDREEVARW